MVEIWLDLMQSCARHGRHHVELVDVEPKKTESSQKLACAARARFSVGKYISRKIFRIAFKAHVNSGKAYQLITRMYTFSNATKRNETASSK